MARYLKIDGDEDGVITTVELTGREVMSVAYGKVTEVRFYGAPCAAFAIHDRLSEQELKREYFRSRDLCHPNVLKFLGLYSTSKPLSLLVTEMVHETVTSFVESQSRLPLHVKLCILLDVSKGLWYLHAQNPPIVHGSLSCDSIFLTDQLEAKISTLKLDNSESTKSKAQEALLETQYDSGLPIDVFSYGSVVLHVVNQELPKPLIDNEAHRNPKMIAELKHQGYLSNIVGLEVPLLPLVETCLSGDPTI